jgi:hypothetical protein
MRPALKAGSFSSRRRAAQHLLQVAHHVHRQADHAALVHHARSTACRIHQVA